MSVKLDKNGREVVDPTPSPLNLRRHKMVGLSDQMRQTVMQMRHEAAMAEADSENDEKDFDLEDDEPRSPHELFVETPEYEMLLDDIAEYGRKVKRAAEPKDENSDPAPSTGKPPAAKKGNPPPAAPTSQDD